MGFFDDVGSSITSIGVALVILIVVAILVSTTTSIANGLAPANTNGTVWSLVNNTSGDAATIISQTTDVVRLVFVIALLFLVIFVIKRQSGGGA